MKGEEEKDNKSAFQKMVEADAGLVLSQDNLACILVPNGRNYHRPNRVFLEPSSEHIGFTRIDFDQVRSLSFSWARHNPTFYVVLRNGTELQSYAPDYAILTRFKHWIHQHRMMTLPSGGGDPELAGIYLIERLECLRHLWIGFEDMYTFSFSEKDERNASHTYYDYDAPYRDKTVASGRICDECAKLERLEMSKCKHVLNGFLLVQLTDGKTKVCLRTTQKQAVAIHARYIRWITQNRSFVIGGQEQNKRLPFDVGLSRLVYDSAQEENEAKKRRKTEQPVCGWL